VGQKRLETAVAAFQEWVATTAASSASANSTDTHSTPSSSPYIRIEWKPFFINPAISLEGEDLEEYCVRRWGSSGWIRHLKAEGAKSGAPFAHYQYACHTMKAHRLIHYAQKNYNIDTSTSNAAIFKALYEEGKNISLVDTLVDIGLHSLHMNSDDDPHGHKLRKYLVSHADESLLQQQVREYQQKFRISGVPFFIISVQPGGNDDNSTTISSSVNTNSSNSSSNIIKASSTHSSAPYEISGAQSADTFLQIFQELWEEHQE
jgi:predicted DsbA family dithiol-disulfide isomerase